MALLKNGLLWALLAAAVLCLGAKHVLERRLSGLLETRGPSLYAAAARYHAASLKRYNMGFGLVFSDLLWIRLLSRARHTPTEPGKVSWEFAQLDAITALDRNFSRSYSYGATFLSVFLRDAEGAKLLLEKWVKYFPFDWRTHYTLGYHLYFEMGRYGEAAEHVLRAAAMEGSPRWLSSLGIRLLSETGSLAQALRQAVALFPMVRDPEGRRRLVLRIRALRYALQKASWKRALEEYRKARGGEPGTLADLAPWRDGQNREIASVLEGTEVPEDLLPSFAEAFSFRYDPNTKRIVPVNVQPELELSGIHHLKTDGGT